MSKTLNFQVNVKQNLFYTTFELSTNEFNFVTLILHFFEIFTNKFITFFDIWNSFRQLKLVYTHCMYN